MFAIMIISVVYALLVVLTDYAVVVDVGRIGIFGHGGIGSFWFLLAGCDSYVLLTWFLAGESCLYIRHE